MSRSIPILPPISASFFPTAKRLNPGSDLPRSNIVLARAQLDEAAGAISDVNVIFRVRPSLPKAVTANQGGRIAIDRDGNLFMTVGDRSRSPPWEVAQRLDTHLGKIIHITPDGAPSRTTRSSTALECCRKSGPMAYRSEEGLAIDPATGQLWENENDGPRGGDKVLKIEAGTNSRLASLSSRHRLSWRGDRRRRRRKGRNRPADLLLGPGVIAPSGLAFYRGNLFPQWKNSIFVGGLRGHAARPRLTLCGDKVINEEPLLVGSGRRGSAMSG